MRISTHVRVSAGVCALAFGFVLLVVGGCISHSRSFSLATLPTGDSIQVHEVRRNLRVQQRTVLLGPGNGKAQSLEVAADERREHQMSPEGFDVLQEGSRITVWRIAGSKKEALATIELEQDSPGVLRAPDDSIHYSGARLGCRIRRTLSTAEVGQGESVYLSVASTRDAGSDANADSYWLAWHCEEQDKRTTTTRSVGTTILTREGQACLSDPLRSCPEFDIRWDGKRRAAWVVDRNTNNVVGGFQIEPTFFNDDGIPQFATAETGQLIASIKSP